jgi:hypothetical protein
VIVEYIVRRRISGMTHEIGDVLSDTDVVGWNTLQSLVNLGWIEAVQTCPRCAWPRAEATDSPPAPAPRRGAARLDIDLSPVGGR